MNHPGSEHIPGSPRRDRDEIVARLVAHGVSVVKAGKIAKAALRTSDPVATAERLYSEYRRITAMRTSVEADRAHGRPSRHLDLTGDLATSNAILTGGRRHILHNGRYQEVRG